MGQGDSQAFHGRQLRVRGVPGTAPRCHRRSRRQAGSSKAQGAGSSEGSLDTPRRGGSGAGLWVATAIVFFLLALGPLLHINGQWDFELDALVVNLPLPYIIFHYIPILKGARIPGRFGIMAVLAVAVLAAMACLWILRRLRSAGWQIVAAGALSVVILVENMAIPLPMSMAAAPEPYHRLAAEPGDFTILQIPLGWRDGFGTWAASVPSCNHIRRCTASASWGQHFSQP